MKVWLFAGSVTGSVVCAFYFFVMSVNRGFLPAVFAPISIALAANACALWSDVK